MKKIKLIILCLFVATLVTNCTKEAESKMQTSNNNFHVELLFEHDGCKVYRFVDYTTMYYTTCNGSVQWSHKNGKTTKHESVQTEIKY